MHRINPGVLGVAMPLPGHGKALADRKVTTA
jgi:hypothetical protein